MTPTDQLIDEASALAGASLAWLGPDAATPLWDLIAARAAGLIGEASSADDRIAAEAARLIVAACHGQADPPIDWWTTPLGRLVAVQFGTDTQRVTQSVAAAMLGVDRGTVAQMMRRGGRHALEAHPDGGIVRGSVFREIARRSGGAA